MFPLPDGGSMGRYLLPAAVAAGTLLVPLTVGFVVGYRTTGRTSERLRAGARAGGILTVLATVVVGGSGLSTVWGTPGYEPSTLLTLIPTVGLIWLLLAGLYTVSVSVIGSVLGGYVRTRSRYAAA
jgi:hypothetical protein